MLKAMMPSNALAIMGGETTVEETADSVDGPLDLTDVSKEHARELLRALKARRDREHYRDNPVAYARDKFDLIFTAKQELTLQEIVKPPHRVMVESANGVGKSLLAAFLCVWFYDTRDPSNIILTAPTFDQVCDVTFKEIRRLMGDRKDLLPKAPKASDHVGHLMRGLTASSPTAFQGRRENSNLMVFEECAGIGAEFWEAARFMLTGGSESYFLSILNPTDNSGHAYVEKMSGSWVVISISAFEHPNILAELEGREPPIPAAVRLGQLCDNLDSTGVWVSEAEAKPTDCDTWAASLYGVDYFSPEAKVGLRKHFPKRFWCPSPAGESRILGRYPTQSAYSVFSEAAFALCERSRGIEPQAADPIVIGCDVARFGDDDTTIHVRRGICSIEHYTYHGQDTTQTARRLISICKRLGAKYKQNPLHIRVNIDDTGVGGGVTDQRFEDAIPGDPDNPNQERRSYNFIGVNNQCLPCEPEKYPNVRSEGPYCLSDRMNEGRCDLSRLPADVRQTLRLQALQVIYWQDGRSRRVLEQKSEIKRRLGRSPDDLDAFWLAYYEPATGQITGGVSKKQEPAKPFEKKFPTPTSGILADKRPDRNRR
jgi:hypothetical protein